MGSEMCIRDRMYMAYQIFFKVTFKNALKTDVQNIFLCIHPDNYHRFLLSGHRSDRGSVVDSKLKSGTTADAERTRSNILEGIFKVPIRYILNILKDPSSVSSLLSVTTTDNGQILIRKAHLSVRLR